MAQLEPNGVVQRYGRHTVVDGVDFRLEIRLHGEVVSRAGWSTLPEKRRIGMIFQDYALFPHLTVEQNVAFGLGRKPWDVPYNLYRRPANRCRPLQAEVLHKAFRGAEVLSLDPSHHSHA